MTGGVISNSQSENSVGTFLLMAAKLRRAALYGGITVYRKRGIFSQISLHFWGIPFIASRSLYRKRGVISQISLHFWGIPFNANRSLYRKRGVFSQISLHFWGF